MLIACLLADSMPKLIFVSSPLPTHCDLASRSEGHRNKHEHIYIYMYIICIHKSTVMPRSNVIAEILSEILEVKK